jgi:hypothetical protein
MVSSKKKWTVMNPIRRQMKKRNPSSGQNGQVVHWWLLIHSGPEPVKENQLQLLTALWTDEFLDCTPNKTWGNHHTIHILEMFIIYKMLPPFHSLK